jgi:hypothetical protein
LYSEGLSETDPEDSLPPLPSPPSPPSLLSSPPAAPAPPKTAWAAAAATTVASEPAPRESAGAEDALEAEAGLRAEDVAAAGGMGRPDLEAAYAAERAAGRRVAVELEVAQGRWAQWPASLQQSRAADRLASLDLQVAHIIGVGLEELSAAQLDSLVDVHDEMIRGLTEAKLEVARRQREAELEAKQLLLAERIAAPAVQSAPAPRRGARPADGGDPGGGIGGKGKGRKGGSAGRGKGKRGGGKAPEPDDDAAPGEGWSEVARNKPHGARAGRATKGPRRSQHT